MKNPLAFLLLSSAALAGCAHRDARPEVVSIRQGVGGTTVPSVGLESVRYHENLKAYPVGRYIDPNDPAVMHEGHVIYRTETTAKWNLHPNLPVAVSLGPTVAINNPARRTRVLSSELESELANQRARSVEMSQQNQRLSGLIDNLQGMMQTTNQRLQETQGFKNQLDKVEREVDELRAQQEQDRLRQAQKPTATPSATPQRRGLFDFQ